MPIVACQSSHSNGGRKGILIAKINFLTEYTCTSVWQGTLGKSYEDNV